MLANAHAVLDGRQKPAPAQVHDVSGGSYAAGLDIDLDRDNNFDSRIRTLFHGGLFSPVRNDCSRGRQHHLVKRGQS